MILSRDDDLKFVQLYSTYRTSLLHLARNIIRDDIAAEDIVQITMLKTMKLIPDIQAVDSPRTRALLYRITRNTAIDYYRKWKKDTLLLSQCRSTFPYVTQYTPEDTCLNAAYLCYLLRMLRQIPKIYQEVIRLRCILGFSARESADFLHIKESTVNTRLYRARKLLAQLLNDSY